MRELNTEKLGTGNKEYTKPTLSEHGDLKSITQGGECASPDFPEGGGVS